VLVSAATSGDPKFFLGTDSAPHERAAKEAPCGCAGMFNATVALSVYAEIFETADALHHLEGFASHHGAAFYGLPPPTGSIVLRREPWTVPEAYAFAQGSVVPMAAGETLAWRVTSS
jgi:dihydroorotase